MNRGTTWRSDLVTLWRDGGAEFIANSAELLEFQPPNEEESAPIDQDMIVSSDAKTESKPKNSPETEWTQFDPAPVNYWRLISYRNLKDGEHGARPDEYQETRREGDTDWRCRPQAIPLKRPLASPRELLTSLRKIANQQNTHRGPDLLKLTDRISQGEFVDPIPIKRAKSWSGSLHVILDRSRRLTPFWDDQVQLRELLKDFYPSYTLTIALLPDGDQRPITIWPDSQQGVWQPPVEMASVLALSDLGCSIESESERNRVQRFWEMFGLRLRSARNHAMALLPCSQPMMTGRLAALWNHIGWERAPVQGDSAESLDRLVEKLIRLCAANLLETGLLREIRRLLPGGMGRPELESRVWTHEYIASRHVDGASYRPEDLEEIRSQQLTAVPDALTKEANQLIRAWHAQHHPSIWFEELLCMSPQSRSEFASDHEDAVHYMQGIATATKETDVIVDRDIFTELARAFKSRIPGWLRRDKRVGDAVKQIMAVARPHEQGTRGQDLIDERLHLQIHQRGNRLVFSPQHQTEPETVVGSWLGELSSDERSVTLSFEEPAASIPDPNQLGERFWESGKAPSWASDWGGDSFGLWCTLRVGDVTQKLRWIEEGSFTMGSPHDEDGRFDDEGPLHKVTIGRGFWLFDSPVTQSFWSAVMGENPSYFKGSDRPVERVSWDDARQFISRLNSQHGDLGLRLPREAEWEYSCRSGSSQARYGALGEIAWYADNSGKETHAVRSKTPNSWGLYDMLGNVWEWCEDNWQRAYSEEPQVDPQHIDDAASERVIRGGCWDYTARYARAAYRHGLHRGNRNLDLGFRCLSSSEQGQVSGAAVSGSKWSRGGADATASGKPSRSGEAPNGNQPGIRKLTWREDAEPLETDLPESNWINVATERTRLSLHRAPAPAWSVASGCDTLGLWSELEFKGVKQRLRWIPPGQFPMGSPDDEEGRDDREGPRHDVTITTGFWCFDTPCTQALWRAVMGNNPSRFTGDLQRPVERVNWDESRRFAQRLNQELPDLHLRLPTEAEWEYACRAGSSEARYGDLHQIAWNVQNSNQTTHPVKEKLPNRWGLFDMLGNVWEWCEDASHRVYSSTPQIDPRHVDEAASGRVIRGGSWGNTARLARAAFRNGYHRENRRYNLGFRCLSSSEPSGQSGEGVSGSEWSRGGADATATSEPSDRADTEESSSR